MPWEYRGTHRYFYRWVADKDQGSKKVYYGRGDKALLAYLEELAIQRDQQRDRRFSTQCSERFEESKNMISQGFELIRICLEAHGYHNPDHRGLRRIRKMVDFNTTAPEETIERPDSETLTKTMGKCLAKDDSAAIKIRRWMRAFPDLFANRESTVEQTQYLWVSRLATDPLQREMLIGQTERLKDGLRKEGDGSVIESVIIDQLVLTQIISSYWSLLGKPGAEHQEYLVKAMHQTQDRHRAAIQMLIDYREKIATVNGEINPHQKCGENREQKNTPVATQKIDSKSGPAKKGRKSQVNRLQKAEC